MTMKNVITENSIKYLEAVVINTELACKFMYCFELSSSLLKKSFLSRTLISFSPSKACFTALHLH